MDFVCRRIKREGGLREEVRADMASLAEWLLARGVGTDGARAHLSGMLEFARWFEQTYGEPLSPDRVTAKAAQAYQTMLLVGGRRPGRRPERRRTAHLRRGPRGAVLQQEESLQAEREHSH